MPWFVNKKCADLTCPPPPQKKYYSGYQPTSNDLPSSPPIPPPSPKKHITEIPKTPPIGMRFMDKNGNITPLSLYENIRPCQIGNKEHCQLGWFHRWAEIEQCSMKTSTMAIVELDSGKIITCNPTMIKFTDMN